MRPVRTVKAVQYREHAGRGDLVHDAISIETGSISNAVKVPIEALDGLCTTGRGVRSVGKGIQRGQAALGSYLVDRPIPELSPNKGHAIEVPIRTHRQPCPGVGSVGSVETVHHSQRSRGGDLEDGTVVVGSAVGRGAIKVAIAALGYDARIRRRGWVSAVGPEVVQVDVGLRGCHGRCGHHQRNSRPCKYQTSFNWNATQHQPKSS